MRVDRQNYSYIKGVSETGYAIPPEFSARESCESGPTEGIRNISSPNNQLFEPRGLYSNKGPRGN